MPTPEISTTLSGGGALPAPYSAPHAARMRPVRGRAPPAHGSGAPRWAGGRVGGGGGDCRPEVARRCWPQVQARCSQEHGEVGTAGIHSHRVGPRVQGGGAAVGAHPSPARGWAVCKRSEHPCNPSQGGSKGLSAPSRLGHRVIGQLGAGSSPASAPGPASSSAGCRQSARPARCGGRCWAGLQLHSARHAGVLRPLMLQRCLPAALEPRGSAAAQQRRAMPSCAARERLPAAPAVLRCGA